jgi:ABC-type transporter Mla subunit MlaD
MKTMFVGLVFLVAVILLIAGTIIIGRLNFGGDSCVLEVGFPDAGGLQKGDQVKVEGIDMGRIVGLKLRPGGVSVKLALNEPIKIYEDYKITIEQTSLVGGNYVLIKRGSTDKLADLTSLKGSHGEMKEMIELLRSMLKSVRENELIPKLSKIADGISRMFPPK